MFDKKVVDAYQNIKAPDELKEKVLSSCTASKVPERKSWLKNMRLLSSLAACLLLAVAFSIFASRNFDEVSVSVGGKALASEPVELSELNISPAPVELSELNISPAPVELSELNISPALYSAEPRVFYEADVPVEIRVNGTTRISVSGGMMKISDADTNEVLYTGSEFTTDEDVLIHWIVNNGTETKQFEMLIDGHKKDFVLILNYDENTGRWTICEETITD